MLAAPYNKSIKLSLGITVMSPFESGSISRRYKLSRFEFSSKVKKFLVPRNIHLLQRQFLADSSVFESICAIKTRSVNQDNVENSLKLISNHIIWLVLGFTFHNYGLYSA